MGGPDYRGQCVSDGGPLALTCEWAVGNGRQIIAALLTDLAKRDGEADGGREGGREMQVKKQNKTPKAAGGGG